MRARRLGQVGVRGAVPRIAGASGVHRLGQLLRAVSTRDRGWFLGARVSRPGFARLVQPGGASPGGQVGSTGVFTGPNGTRLTSVNRTRLTSINRTRLTGFHGL